MVYQLPAQTYFYQKDIIVLNVGNGGMIYNNYQFHHPSNPQQPIQQPYVFNAPVSHWGIKKNKPLESPSWRSIFLKGFPGSEHINS